MTVLVQHQNLIIYVLPYVTGQHNYCFRHTFHLREQSLFIVVDLGIFEPPPYSVTAVCA